MSKPNSQITLVCLMQGNTPAEAFVVDINKNKLVCHLKETIKKKKHNTFLGLDASDIKLWKVDISVDKFYKQELKYNYELEATNTIGDYWSDNQPKRYINIIVSPSRTIETTSCELFDQTELQRQRQEFIKVDVSMSFGKQCKSFIWPIEFCSVTQKNINEDKLPLVEAVSRSTLKTPFVCKWSQEGSHPEPLRFKTQKNLYFHIEIDHKDDLARLKVYACPLDKCNKLQNGLTKLKEHLIKHTQQMPFKCPFPFCTHRFGFPKKLKRHLVTSHADVIVDTTGDNDMTSFEGDYDNDDDDSDDDGNVCIVSPEDDDEKAWNAICSYCDPSYVNELKKMVQNV